jgi:hypothetical protein
MGGRSKKLFDLNHEKAKKIVPGPGNYDVSN